jgi:hypothetical protein
MDLGEVGWGDVDWIGLAQDRNRWRALVNSVFNLRVRLNAWKLSSGLTSSGLLSSAQLHRVSYIHSGLFTLLSIFPTVLLHVFKFHSGMLVPISSRHDGRNVLPPLTQL